MTPREYEDALARRRELVRRELLDELARRRRELGRRLDYLWWQGFLSGLLLGAATVLIWNHFIAR